MHAGAPPVPRPAQVVVTNQAALMAEIDGLVQDLVLDEIDALMEELVLDTALQAIQPEMQVSLPRVAIGHGKPEQQYHVPCAMCHAFVLCAMCQVPCAIHSCFVPCARCHVPYIRTLHIADLRRLAYYAGGC